MNLFETTVSQKMVYQGVIVNVRRDKILLCDGSDGRREVVEHPGGVTICAIDEMRRVVMVRQYRYSVGEALLELPAGKLEAGEDVLESALRELEEETGVIPSEVIPMGFSYSSPGIFTEKIHYFLARGLHQGTARPDEGEFLEVVHVPLEELMQMIREDRLSDGKTLIGILKAALILQEEEKEELP